MQLLRAGLLVLLLATPVVGQTTVLVQPSSTEDMEEAVRSTLKEAPLLKVLSEKDIDRKLDALDLDADELEDDQWRQLALFMEADYLLRASSDGVAAVDRGGATLFTLQGSPDEVATALPDRMESLIEYRRDLLFCADYLQSGQYTDALRNCHAALEMYPSPSAHTLLGTTLMRAGRCAEAVEHLEAAAAAVEGRSSADVELAQARECAGDTEGALAEASALVSSEDSLSMAQTLGEAPSEVESEYDRFDDVTTYFTPWYIARLTPDLRYRAQIRCSSSERCEPAVVQLIFASRSSDWEFLRDRRLVILADEEKIEIEELEWLGDVKGPGVSEVLGGSLTPVQAAAIGSAEKAEARLGGHEFQIGEGAQQGVAQLLASE